MKKIITAILLILSLNGFSQNYLNNQKILIDDYGNMTLDSNITVGGVLKGNSPIILLDGMIFVDKNGDTLTTRGVIDTTYYKYIPRFLDSAFIQTNNIINNDYGIEYVYFNKQDNKYDVLWNSFNNRANAMRSSLIIGKENLDTTTTKFDDFTILDGDTTSGGDLGITGDFESKGNIKAQGVVITDYVVSKDSTDTLLVSNICENKSVILQMSNGYSYTISNWRTERIDETQDVNFSWTVPPDFTELISAEVLIIPDNTETIQYDLESNIVSTGDTYSSNEQTAANETTSVIADKMTLLDVSDVLTGLDAGEHLTIDFNSDTEYIYVVHLVLKYK